jgi:hypothetical protein
MDRTKFPKLMARTTPGSSNDQIKKHGKKKVNEMQSMSFPSSMSPTTSASSSSPETSAHFDLSDYSNSSNICSQETLRFLQEGYKKSKAEEEKLLKALSDPYFSSSSSSSSSCLASSSSLPSSSFLSSSSSFPSSFPQTHPEGKCMSSEQIKQRFQQVRVGIGVRIEIRVRAIVRVRIKHEKIRVGVLCN